MGVVGLDRHVHARQMAGKRAAIGAALLGALARPRRVLLVVVGFGRRNGLLDILERQIELIDPGRASPSAGQIAPAAAGARDAAGAHSATGLDRAPRSRRHAPQAPSQAAPAALRYRSEVEVRSRSRVTANQIRAPSWRTICSLIQWVTVLTKSRSDAARRSRAAGTSPCRRRAQPAAMRSIASHRR